MDSLSDDSNKISNAINQQGGEHNVNIQFGEVLQLGGDWKKELATFIQYGWERLDLQHRLMLKNLNTADPAAM
ncbi:hypothetical protein CCR75_003850 [Bremia lactucae]|uniref:Uncharacterized protein n=1 Tax=Bremia lactucae TaxID=4779 RepID=A0A976ILC2_BRELC|nr:hypothetical protein CCR75_003850 [Bremia lactucae]